MEANDHVSLFHMSRKNIKDVDTYNSIHKFQVAYVSMPFKKNRTLREQVDFLQGFI